MHRATAHRLPATEVEIDTDPEQIARYLEDAAHFPGGHARAVARPESLADVASVVRGASHVLPVGAQSSLTGGATPSGDVVLSTERLADISVKADRVVAGAGVTLQAIQDALASRQSWLPPVPTFLGATVGGVVSTNAAGAATFKYGTMRDWVEALTIVLASGDVLEIARGEVTASADHTFELALDEGACTIEIPRLTMPQVPKRSAGYHAASGMDLVDLFIGAEGTLGVIVDATLRTQPRPAAVCWLMVPLASESQAIDLAGRLRQAAKDAWISKGNTGIDVAAIEHIDRRSLDVVRADRVDSRIGVFIAPATEVVLLAQIELHQADAARDLWNDIASAREAAEGTPLSRLCRLLEAEDLLDAAEIALPADTRRAAALIELREAVPAGVNRRVAAARADDARIHKTAADMIVPYERFGQMMSDCRALFDAAGLDLAVWGHISDGNVHPNVIPRSYEDVVRGRETLIELARRVIAMKGCPLAEHGVGRNAVKQQMLAMLYGQDGVNAMRRVKQALDPSWKLAAGVVFRRDCKL